MISVSRAYDNIEKVITYGFLMAGLRWDGNLFILKNITDKEYHNLKYFKVSDDQYTDLLYHVAFCTAIVNNENFLQDRHVKIIDLLKFYSSIPAVFLFKIKDTIRELNDEYLNSIDFLEGFCYTDRSRYLWRTLDLSYRDEYVGFPGLKNTGLNSVQENWTIINKRLDDEDVYKKDFHLSILVASSFNPKGAKAISRNYDFQMKELDELRKEIAEYGHDRRRIKEQHKPEGWAQPLRSKEELVKELYREMSGDKDKHDLFIEKWLRQQKAKAEEAKRKAEERQNIFRQRVQVVDAPSEEDSRPISSEDLKKRIKIRGGDGNKGLKSYISSYEGTVDKEVYLKKLSSTVIRSE